MLVDVLASYVPGVKLSLGVFRFEPQSGILRIQPARLPQPLSIRKALQMASSAPSHGLLSSLARLRCTIFQTAWYPTSACTGTEYLRTRLRGPSPASYYPARVAMSIGALNRANPGFNLVDVDEVKRLIAIEEHKARGEGAPKKAKTKGE